MQTLFYASALLFFEVCGLLISALFYKRIGVILCVVPSYQRIQSYAVPCSPEYEYFKEHVLNKFTLCSTKIKRPEIFKVPNWQSLEVQLSS
jgi:hypothetical protein